MYRVAIVCLSDKGYRGEREDKSSSVIEEMVVEKGYKVSKKVLIPDEYEMIVEELKTICDKGEADLVLTTGGTGFSKRDVTPEATLDVVEKVVPGIPEAMRYYSLQITPKAMLTRAAAGIRRETLIINLPGSPKAVKENLEFILGPVDHGLEILLGQLQIVLESNNF